MIYLDGVSVELQGTLAGSITSNQLEGTVCYYDENQSGEQTKGALQNSSSNHITDFTLLSPPQQGFIRCIEYISLYNADSVTATPTVKIQSGASEYRQVRQALAPGESLVYDQNNGWQVM